MIVARVEDATGSHIEPPLDEAWGDFTKLRWKAAAVAFDTGLPITVREGGLSRLVHGEWQAVPGTYSLTVGRASSSGYDYLAAWGHLTGVSIGALEAQRLAREAP